MSLNEFFQSSLSRQKRFALFATLLVGSIILVEQAEHEKTSIIRDPQGLSSVATRAAEALAAIHYPHQIYPNHQQYLFDQHQFWRISQGYDQCLESSWLPDKGFCLHNYITKHPKEMKRYLVEKESQGTHITVPLDSKYAEQLRAILESGNKTMIPLPESEMTSNASI